VIRALAALLPFVSVDVLPADIPAEYAPEMAAACTEALPEGSCVLAASLPESAQPNAVALVLWQDQRYLRVTVRVGRGDGQWLVRSLTFSEGDAPSERWIAVGLTVATLVGETQAKSRQVPAPDAGLPVTVERTPQLRSRRFEAALGALAGPGWNAGDPQFGGWLSAGFRWPATPLALHAFGSYALSNGPDPNGETLRTRWLTLGVSAGVVGTLHALDVKASAAIELAFRQLRVELDDRSLTDEELPLRLRLLASYPAETPFGLTLGTIGRIPPLGPAESDGERLRGPRFALEFVAGVEVRL
jgi:hypothetical protein